MATDSHGRAEFHQLAAESTCGVNRRSNSRPARASSTRKSTCAPKYGAGLTRRTVAWISCRSSVGACAESFLSTDVMTDDIGASSPGSGPIPARTAIDFTRRLLNLVEKFLDGRTDFLEPSRLGDGEVRRSDIPAIGRNLVVCDP